MLLALLLLFQGEIIHVMNNSATLEGNLELPPGIAKVPLVIFVHGSGRATRYDYDRVARKLLGSGYAIFRYDKRGVGGSTGTFVEVGTSNSNERIPLLASDAAAAVRDLKKNPRIDSKRIIVMGGSQAGWIIPVVASMVDVKATVLVSGPTVSVGEEIYYSDLAEHGTMKQEDADQMLKAFKGQRGFDNTSYVSKMEKPSLWIFGGKDVSIPVKRCVERLDSIKRAARLPAEIKIYPNADHGIYNESANRYEDYVPVIVQWLKTLP